MSDVQSTLEKAKQNNYITVDVDDGKSLTIKVPTASKWLIWQEQAGVSDPSESEDMSVADSINMLIASSEFVIDWSGITVGDLYPLANLSDDEMEEEVNIDDSEGLCQILFEQKPHYANTAVNAINNRISKIDEEKKE